MLRRILFPLLALLIATSSHSAAFTWTDIDLEKRSEQATALSATQHDNNMTKLETGVNSTGEAVAALNEYGEMFQTDNAVATTIATINVWVLVENFGAGHIDGMTFAADGLTVAVGDYQVRTTISFTAAGTNKTYQYAYGIDGVIDTDHITERLAGTTAIGACSVGGILEATAGQKISLYVRNITDNTDLTIKHSTVVVRKIHN